MITAPGTPAPDTPAPSTGVLQLDRTAPPDQSTQVHLEGFDGPLALLLTLIEQRQLDVLDVPLGDLAGAYLTAISELEAPMPHLSAFITVSAQLILIKSRALLPRSPQSPLAESEAGGDPEAELRERLIIYRQFRDAAARLGQRLENGGACFHRDAAVAVASGAAGARPTSQPSLNPTLLTAALTASLRLIPPDRPPAQVMRRQVTLEERSAVIRGALRRSGLVVLQDLLHDIDDRVVAAITFLAMLELVKSREIRVAQETPWGPIVCRSTAPP